GHLLRELCDARTGLEAHPPAIWRDGPRDDAEQRRLAGAIASEQAHPLPSLEPQRHAVEQRRVAERQRDVLELEKGHVSLTCPAAAARRPPTWRSAAAARRRAA